MKVRVRLKPASNGLVIASVFRNRCELYDDERHSCGGCFPANPSLERTLSGEMGRIYGSGLSER